APSRAPAGIGRSAGMPAGQEKPGPGATEQDGLAAAPGRAARPVQPAVSPAHPTVSRTRIA
ncbi:MAG TPA: hypothetical protein VF612_01170, partial [Jatrophihabitans sp.]|uniref:hypothetical protein n=1 Tax=Jatrophihabitans sp. TaxID=1932789 RepID=UPI002F03A282